MNNGVICLSSSAGGEGVGEGAGEGTLDDPFSDELYSRKKLGL